MHPFHNVLRFDETWQHWGHSFNFQTLLKNFQTFSFAYQQVSGEIEPVSIILGLQKQHSSITVDNMYYACFTFPSVFLSEWTFLTLQWDVLCKVETVNQMSPVLFSTKSYLRHQDIKNTFSWACKANSFLVLNYLRICKYWKCISAFDASFMWRVSSCIFLAVSCSDYDQSWLSWPNDFDVGFRL